MAKILLKYYSARLHEFLTYVLFFALPFQDRFLPLALGLWCGSWLIWRLANIKSRYPLAPKIKTAGFLFLAFVLYNYSSTLWGFDTSLGGSIIEHRLSMLILVVVLLLGLYPNLRKETIIRSYFYGSLTALMLFLFRFIISYLTDGVLKFQVSIIGLDDVIDAYKHPAYMALNLVLSYYLFLTTIQIRFKVQVVTSIVSYFLIFAFIYVSGSRAGLLSLALLSIGVLFYIAHKYFAVWKMLIIALPFIAVFSLGIVNSRKFQLILDTSEQVAVRAPRKVLWKSALEMYAEKPLFGFGIGSSREEFIVKCKENGIEHAAAVRFNVHNQFLESLLESGSIGLLLLIMSLFYFVKGGTNENRLTAMGIIAIISFAFLFESMLLRIAGVSIFVSTLLLLAVMSKEDKSRSLNQGQFSALLVSVVALLLIIVLFMFSYSHKLDYDATDPLTYAYKDFSLVKHEDLPSDLPAILLEDVIDGAMYDDSSEPSLWSGNAYLINKIAEKNLKEDEKLIFSAFCYVSPKFDGDWVKVSIDEEGKSSMVQDFYDLDNKGSWQKLQVEVDDKTGPMPAHFFFARHDCNSFEDMPGYVIFAYPQYIITKK